MNSEHPLTLHQQIVALTFEEAEARRQVDSFASRRRELEEQLTQILGNGNGHTAPVAKTKTKPIWGAKPSLAKVAKVAKVAKKMSSRQKISKALANGAPSKSAVLRDKIEQFLQASDELPVSIDTLAEQRFSKSRTELSQALFVLRQKGRAKRVGAGLWAAVKSAA